MFILSYNIYITRQVNRQINVIINFFFQTKPIATSLLNKLLQQKTLLL